MKIIFVVLASIFFIACNKDNDPDTPPIAKFGYSVQRFFPATVTFTNTSTGGGTYEWDFGDGSQHAFSTDAVHSYAAPGVYNVRLIQTPPTGPKDTVTVNVSVSPFGPSGTSSRINTASFTFSVLYTSYIGNFQNNSTGGNNTYLWDFGDGQTATSTNSVQHQYAGPGTYHVVLTATNSAGTDTSGAVISF